jgi:hypothetical protein
MPRHATVANTGLSFQEYLDKCADDGRGVIIVPPGVYSFLDKPIIGERHSNTTIYLYGVYIEYAETNYHAYKVPLLHLIRAKNVNVYGLTMGAVLPTCGQIRIIKKYIEKDAEGKDMFKLLVATDAGFLDGFTKTDPAIFHTWWPEIFYADENGKAKLYAQYNQQDSHSIQRNLDENGNYDGTMTMTLYDRGTNERGAFTPAKFVFDKINPGTLITCR